MTEISILNVSMLEDEALFAKAMQMISEERAEKIRKFKNPVPAKLSLGAGVLLTFALEKFDLKDKLGEIKNNIHGKPYLPNEDFYFSLSHSGNYALCAISDAPVGADLQKIKEKIPDKTGRILSAEEKRYLDELPESVKRELFYRLWARKESFIKWDGRGLRLPMQKFSFIQGGCLMNEIGFEEERLFFREYDMLLPDYSICICGENRIFSEKIKEITRESLTKY